MSERATGRIRGADVEACEGDDISRVSRQVRGRVELGRLDERYGGWDKLEHRHDNW